MDVIIDGSGDFDLRGEPEDLLVVVAMVNDHLRERGRSLVRLEVDGEVILPDTLTEKLAGKAPAEVGVIRCESEEIASLVNNCLSELRTALPELPVVCRHLAEVFQGESPEEGYDSFRELVEIWLHVKRREKLICDALDMDADALEVEGRKASVLYQELNGFLEEAAQALQDGDTVLLGDLLEYELAPRAELEAAIVDEIQARSQPKGG